MSTTRLANFASILEDDTRAQAERTASMPFVRPHVALMPDAHLGKGATVGSVIPTDGAIIPAAVGVDIGCGMMAVRTQFSRADLTGDLTELHHAIASAIPLSAGRYNQTVAGTAHSGNHVIEVSLDETDGVWLFLNSGSRGVGNKLAQKHIKVAQEQCAKRWIRLPDPDLAYLVEGDPEFWSRRAHRSAATPCARS